VTAVVGGVGIVTSEGEGDCHFIRPSVSVGGAVAAVGCFGRFAPTASGSGRAGIGRQGLVQLAGIVVWLGANGGSVDMRRIVIAALVSLLMVGLIAAPAAADRADQGRFPHEQAVATYGEIFGQPDVRELATGDWAAVIPCRWGTATEEQRDDFFESVTVELYVDGVLQDGLVVWFFPAPTPYVVYFKELPPGAANKPVVVTSVVTFTKDHFDGWDWYPAGTVFEDDRTIVWTPRGQFPSGDYPPSDF